MEEYWTMSEMLDMLREKNPGLKLYSVLDSEFAPYGRVIDADTTELAAALEETPIPESGNAYQASVAGLEAVTGIMDMLYRRVFGCMELEGGYCNGNGYTLNALEYHKCSEVNFSTTGAVLLMALPGQVKDGHLYASDVVGFYLPKGVMIEVYPQTLHFAPCRINEGGFRVLVVLEKGTNAALDSVDTKAPGEEKLLWMRNKWMICHPDSPQAVKGAFIGIHGENIQLHI